MDLCCKCLVTSFLIPYLLTAYHLPLTAASCFLLAAKK